MYEYKATITRVIDGDTVVAEIKVGFSIVFKQKLRILYLDTPETYRPKSDAERQHGIKATERARYLLENKELIIKTKKDKQGKFGRYLASIVLPDGSDYATTMINEGFEKKLRYI